MLAYSAIKIRANIPALYSTLNPYTNSDSPSAKSNGVRFVSARFVMNHIRNRGVIISIIHDLEKFLIMFRSIDLCRIKTDNRISAIDTSYEIVWAIPRSAPRSAYLELEHHPAIKVVYTFILDTHRKNKIPYEKNIELLEWGYRVHSMRAKINPRTGANIYDDIFAGVGLVCSFANNLMASAKGWGIPISATLLGPFRSWK